ncbi:uncharacterized protein LOC121683663 [Alosa sapidissima]|uniref:uncharacterized protein LOC121683663 n=1 Tax=Alosa sapidissima TaxID=34773 RepID=UPI001C0A0866|nr:uncharacterized protein LOC121683663 [Alosa sapidissima]
MDRRDLEEQLMEADVLPEQSEMRRRGVVSEAHSTGRSQLLPYTPAPIVGGGRNRQPSTQATRPKAMKTRPAMEDWDAWDESADEALICPVCRVATADGVSVLYQPASNAMADAASRTAARKREGGDNETTNENGHGNGKMDGSIGNRNIFENDDEKCMMSVTKKVKETSEEGKRESLANIIDIQNSSSREEKWIWIENVAKLHDDNLWRFGTRTVAPESLLPYLTAQIHSLGHVGVEKIRNRFIQVWWSPKFTATATDIVKWCVTCRQNNHDKKVKLPMLKTPAPPGPFRVLQIDYITLPKCKGYRDVLVVLCKFSRWIEAFPTRSGTALHTAKVLVKDIIPRYGLPEQICSDQILLITQSAVKVQGERKVDTCKPLQTNRTA